MGQTEALNEIASGVKSASLPEATEADAVEQALADALRGATAAGQWQLVVQLAAELQVRREARQKVASADVQVISLEAHRGKRGQS